MSSIFADRAARGPGAAPAPPRYSVGMAYPRPGAGGSGATGPGAEPADAAAARPARWRPLAHGAGALVSVAVLAGLALWGYGQVMRDVAGVPVVQAAGGPMRIAPDAPGGVISDHKGLSVNAIKAGGSTGEAAAPVRLAAPPVALAAEDRPATELAPGRAAAAVPGRADGDGPAAGLLPTLRDARGGAGPGPTEATLAVATPQELALAQAVAAALITGEGTAATAGGAPRPLRRPAPAQDVASRGGAPAEAPEVSRLAAPAPGTRLAQLGAFPSPEEATAAWSALAARFAPLMERKTPVVQEAEAAGRTLWRLRARGFDDLAQARRFCAALVAEGADCIPVVAR